MLPISPTSGIVLQVPVEVVDAEAGTIAFTDEDGTRVTQSALGGKAKLQWKVDWAMRWVALGVDYEMAGKDLIDSTIQSGKIARVLGGRPPEGFNYEMFLDEKGEKISKSKGNGLSLDQWLTYGSEESLAFFAYREPKKAKSLHIGVIPRAVDEYCTVPRQLRRPAGRAEARQSGPPHPRRQGARRRPAADLRPAAQPRLACPASSDKATAWKFVQRYAPGTVARKPTRARQADRPRGQLCARLRRPDAQAARPESPTKSTPCATSTPNSHGSTPPTPGDEIQTIVFEVGKRHPFESLRHWFQALYETLLGSSQGPRMGSFIALYGIENSRKLIAEALAS